MNKFIKEAKDLSNEITAVIGTKTGGQIIKSDTGINRQSLLDEEDSRKKKTERDEEGELYNTKNKDN
jgi:hypothetical protein